MWYVFLKRVGIFSILGSFLVVGFYYFIDVLKAIFSPEEVPYFLRFFLALIAITILVFLFRVIVGESYDALQKSREAKK